MSVVMLTKTPLQANMSYIQAGRDRFESGIPAGSVSGLVWADKAGTLYLEESDDDGVTWSQTTNVSVSASTTTVLPWTALTKQQYRFRYVNGAAAQTKFRLVQQTRGMELTTVDLSPLENRIDAITSGDTPATAQLTGSNVEAENGEDIAPKSALVAGKSPNGKQIPVAVDLEGKIKVTELPGILSQELRPGKNLFNKDTAIADYLISSNGELSPSAGWTTSDFIPVKSNSDITVNKMRYLAEYDENKQFIKRYDSESPGGGIEATLTTTEETAYIRVTTASAQLDILQVEYGTEVTSYEPYHTELYIGGKKYHEVYADPKLTSLETEIKAIKDTAGIKKIVDTVNVQLSGSIETVVDNPATGIKTITTTAAELFAGAYAKTNRRKLILKNEDQSLRFRIGKADITQQNGFPVEPGAVVIIPFDPAVIVPIYAISEGASLQASVMEV